MFTGLIEEIGTVRGVRATQQGKCFVIASHFTDLALGDSVAVQGVCLTVTRKESGGGFQAEASAETLRLTTLGSWRAGTPVHLERALQAHARLGGHLVSGHVDGIGTLDSLSPLGDAKEMKVTVPPRLLPFLAAKGSVCIDGVSLTVNLVRQSTFSVVLVPYTLQHTRFGQCARGAELNIEVDILAKYVASQLGKPGVDGDEPAQRT